MSGTTDRNWRSFVGPRDDYAMVDPDNWVNPPDPENYDDIFKCSNVDSLTASRLDLPPGREDSIDCVRGSNYLFRYLTVRGSITLKGAIEGWSLIRCVLSGTVEVGQYDNYWYPGRPPTRVGYISECTSPDGKPIRLKLWDATRPEIRSSQVKVTKIPFVIWFPYFCFRYLMNRGWRFRENR